MVEYKGVPYYQLGVNVLLPLGGCSCRARYFDPLCKVPEHRQKAWEQRKLRRSIGLFVDRRRSAAAYPPIIVGSATVVADG